MHTSPFNRETVYTTLPRNFARFLLLRVLRPSFIQRCAENQGQRTLCCYRCKSRISRMSRGRRCGRRNRPTAMQFVEYRGHQGGLVVCCWGLLNCFHCSARARHTEVFWLKKMENSVEYSTATSVSLSNVSSPWGNNLSICRTLSHAGDSREEIVLLLTIVRTCVFFLLLFQYCARCYAIT